MHWQRQEHFPNDFFPKDHLEAPKCVVLQEGWSPWEVDWADKSLLLGSLAAH